MTGIDVANFRRIGDAPYFVFCDHASNAVPDDLNCLGMPEDLLRTHIAWDIGAGALSFKLAKLLNGSHFECLYSRLVIDPNRALAANDVISATSDQIPIPGNQMIDANERRRRIEDYHEPYHVKLAEVIDDLLKQNKQIFPISVHSFTNRLMGAAIDRPWPIGMLWNDDEASAKSMISYLKAETGWRIGDNEPYDAREFNYSVDRHVSPRGLRHLTFEVRQDLISDAAGVDKIAAILAKGIRTVLLPEAEAGWSI